MSNLERVARSSPRCAALALLAVSALIAPRPIRAEVPESGQVFKAPGATIYYEVRGSAAGTPLFVANGGPGFAHTYLHCSDAWDRLAEHRRVVFYDQRGVGRSPRLKPGQSCTLADQIADLEALRAHLRFDKIDLLGHSWGGYLVMAYAARHPEHIAHLIISDSAAPKWEDTIFLFKDMWPEKTDQEDAVAFAEELGDSTATTEDIEIYLSMLFYSQDNRDRYMVWKKSHAAGYVRPVNETLNTDLKRYDLGPELPKFKFPTLVLTGRFDINVAPVIAWKIHKAIPGSQFTAFDRSGHMPFFEQPAEFVHRVEEFLGGS